MAQQNINFGSGPDDPNADVIRAAFAKCQNNFSELYKSSASSGVTELLVGAGLTQDNTTGKINVSANINQVKVSSTTLEVGINGSTGSNTATLSRGTDTIVINIGNTITTGTIYNAKFGANASNQPNITQLGTLTSLTTLGQITSQISSGTAPLVIASNTLVANLNANLLNGLTTAIPATPSTIVVRSSNGDITANNFIGTMSSTSISVVDNSANNAVTITQLGSGNAFVVTDEPTDTTVFLISNSGGVGIGVNTSISTNAKLEVLGNVKVNNHLTVSTTHSVSGAGLISLVSYSSSLYRSSKHHIQITQASKYQASEVLLIHDGTTAYLTEYGVVYSSTDLGTISAALSGGSVNLQITLTDTGNTASITVLSDITLI